MKKSGLAIRPARLVKSRVVLVIMVLAMGIAPILSSGCLLRKKNPDSDAGKKEAKRK